MRQYAFNEVCAGCYEPFKGNESKIPSNHYTQFWHRRCYATALRVRGFVELQTVVGMMALPTEGET